MKINRQVLVAVLEKLAPLLGNNPIMPEYQYFQIDGDHIQVTNGSLLGDIVCSIDTGLNCSVPKEVFDLLASLDVEEVDLKVTGTELQIKTNKIEGKFTVISPSTFKSLPKVDKNDPGSIDPLMIRDVINGLGFCRFGVSKDIASMHYCGVQLNGDKIFSTDRWRVVKWDLVEDVKVKCVVPVKFIDLLKKYQSDVIYLAVIENEITATLADGFLITATLIPGEKYPDLLPHFSSSEKYEEIRFDGNLTPIVERHSVFLKDISPLDRVMLIEIEDGVCTFTSKVPERSNLVEKIGTKSEAELKLGFSVNPTFLREIANKCSSFKFFDNGLILFEADKLHYLMRTGQVE
jgi:hypothetical protein